MMAVWVHVTAWSTKLVVFCLPAILLRWLAGTLADCCHGRHTQFSRETQIARWRPLELCFWPDQGALPAKGKEYPGLGYKRLRDKPPKAQEQQQQPAEAQ
ncbi:hypothetical protein QJQ45_009382 [Haematococcus lacustris]|nr:hypothetical protein QJQ45_009382 [Haematococcus lacustris]